jgi:hypothetical protein
MSSPEVDDEHATARSDMGRQSPDRGSDRPSEETITAVTDPDEALTTAIQAAVAAGDDDLAAALIALRRAGRDARAAKVVDLASRRARG